MTKKKNSTTGTVWVVQRTDKPSLYFHLVANYSILFGPLKDAFPFNSEGEGQEFIELSEMDCLAVKKIKG